MATTENDLFLNKYEFQVKRFLIFLFEIALLTLCTLPGLYFSWISLQEPWTTARIARSVYSLESDHIATFVTSLAGYRGEHIGGDMVQIALLKFSGWLPEEVGLLPIGSLLIAFMYYVVSIQLTNSRLISSALALYASWYYPMLNSQFSTQTYVWTNLLFLGFLYFLYSWIQKRNIILSSIIVMIFITTFLHYHTTPLWITIALVFSIGVSKFWRRGESIMPKSWALALFCIVFYFSFDTVIYGNGLARVAEGVTSESFLQSFLGKILIPLFYRNTQKLDQFVIAPINPSLATWTTLTVLLILTVPVGIWIILKLIEVFRSRNIQASVSSPDRVFIWSVLLVALGHSIVYLIYGAVSLRVIPIAFPLILPLVLRDIWKSGKLDYALTFLLAACAVIGFASVAPTMKRDVLASETGVGSKLFGVGERILSDANTYAGLLLSSVDERKIIDFVWLDINKYATLVGQESVNPDSYDYVVLDSTSKPIISSEWVFFEPWTAHMNEINQNAELNKIYDSERIMIYRPAGFELPSTFDVAPEIRKQPPSMILESLQILFAIIMMIVVPGVVITAVIFRSSFFQDGNINSAVVLTICSSIALVTFAGYLANFINLKWFFAILLSFILLLILANVAFKLHPVRLNLKSETYPFAFIIVLIFWALLATTVKQYRTDFISQYTEFFVTKSGQSAGEIDIGVITHASQPNSYEIAIKNDEIYLPIKGPFFLQPDLSYSLHLGLSKKLIEKPFSILLLRNGMPFRQLHINNLVHTQAD